MKKILSVFIAILLVTSLNTTVFTAEITEEIISTVVKATYQSGEAAEIVYSVDVNWGSMDFTYNDTSLGTWNPDTHEYDGAGPASWTCAVDANKITVTNHSNTNVSAALSYTSEDGYTGISGSFSKSTINLATAVGVLPEDAPTDNAFLTLAGTLSSSITASTTIGSITIEIT